VFNHAGRPVPIFYLTEPSAIFTFSDRESLRIRDVAPSITGIEISGAVVAVGGERWLPVRAGGWILYEEADGRQRGAILGMDGRAVSHIETVHKLLDGCAYGGPVYPFRIPGVSESLLRPVNTATAGYPPNNCCTYVEMVIVSLHGHTGPTGSAWDSEAHKGAMIMDAKNPWSSIQAYNEYLNGNASQKVLGRDTVTGPIITQEWTGVSDGTVDKGDSGHQRILVPQPSGREFMSYESTRKYGVCKRMVRLSDLVGVNRKETRFVPIPNRVN